MVCISATQRTSCKVQACYIFEEDAKAMGAPWGFDGKMAQTLLLPEAEGTAKLLVGLGSRDFGAQPWPPETTLSERLRRSSAQMAKAMKRFGITDYAVECGTVVDAYGTLWVQEVVMGIYLGNYQISAQTKEAKEEERIQVYLCCKEAIVGLEEALVLAHAVCRVRDLGNTPGNLLSPAVFGQTVAQWGREVGLEAEILGKEDMERLGMGAFLAVGESATREMCLIVLRYQGAPGQPITALIGKGVTCDTGGYCLKSSASMKGIKGDMCGGAAVASAICALAACKASVNVIGVIPACENRISPEALLPGDVIRSMSGKTIEVLNTDAEGRLILCDAMTYAIQKEHATRLVDIATLTGAVVNALGFGTAGLLSNDDAFCQAFLAAAERGGERYWRLPAEGGYRQMLKSKIADIKNIGKDYCGAITAGLFVGEFAQGLPWIHLDIAGTAWTDEPEREDQCAGATGAGVTALYHLLRQG